MNSLLFGMGQSALLFVAIWAVFRLSPGIPPNARAWIWRLAFLKPLFVLLPFATVTLAVLPSTTRIHESVVSQPPASSAPLKAVNWVEESASAPSRPVPKPQVSLDMVLGAAWAAGSLVLLGRALRRWHRAALLVRISDPVTEPKLLEALESLARRAKLSKTPELRASDLAPTAMLLGVRRPVIVLPEAMLSQDQFTDARMMMAHEIAHIVRRDLPWLTGISVIQALSFFNPFVWMAGRACRLDHESATDHLASELAGVNLPTYAGMLVRSSVTFRSDLSVAALPASESYRSIHQRLEAMKHLNHPYTLTKRIATAAIALATLGFSPFYQLSERAPAVQPEPAQNSRAIAPSAAPKAKSKKTKSTWIYRYDDNGKKRYEVVGDGAKPQKDGSFVIQRGGKTYRIKPKGEIIRVIEKREGAKAKPAPVPPKKSVGLSPVAAPAPGAISGTPRRYSVESSSRPAAIGGKAAIAISGGRYESSASSSGGQVSVGEKSAIAISGGTYQSSAGGSVSTGRASFESSQSSSTTSTSYENGRFETTSSSSNRGARPALTMGTQTPPSATSHYSVSYTDKGPIISLEVWNIEVKQVIENLMNYGKKKYRLEGNFAGTVSMTITDATFSQSLSSLARQTGIRVIEENGVLVLRR